MKLALVLPGGVDRGGERRVIPAFVALIERLAARHDVHVFVFHQESQPARWSLRGATIHNIGEGRTQARAIRAIRAEHRVGRFDVVQALFSGSCGWVAAVAGLSLRVPYTVHIAGGELVALHGIDYGGRRRWRSRMREAFVLRAAAAVSAASAPIVEALAGLGIRAQRIPLGVDLARWPVRPPCVRRHGTLRLLHVASLNRVKDLPTALRALALCRRRGFDFVLDVVGVDTLGGEAQALAHQLDLGDRVRFMGFRTQQELRPLMESADLLVMSSLHEAGPLVILEAAVAGVPAVGTAVGHFVEWSPRAALAVPPGDAVALADVIERVARDEALRMRLATEAQRRAVEEDADHTASAFEDLYDVHRR
ncbi:glycosyltransferase family 4 protein [Luteibacter sp. PPL201]|uniref:Glycosyltransferase family 4 protein n=1 Tax=Luteibacter sahnii TaxID=3021977 RepID=A0ABT6B7N8_9GAMM